MEQIYNCHTHIFNIKCAPNGFYGFPSNWLAKPFLSATVARLLKFIVPSERDGLERLGNFLMIGREKSQRTIFEKDLSPIYPNNTRFVVLTLDMDFMVKGKAIKNYLTQIAEIVELKKIYPYEVLPFLCVDPRRGNANELLKFVKHHIENLGFIGIKLYPSLGFYPFDPNLYKVYEYASVHQIPIMTHCSTGGIFYRKELTSAHLTPNNINESSIYTHNYTSDKDKKRKVFKNHFLHPRNYEEVLAKFKDLKICFAHFGIGDEQAKKGKNFEWYEKIKELLKNSQYPNLYTDISYTLAYDNILGKIIQDIKNSEIQHKVLFGTDFYMTIQEKKEDKLVSDFRNRLDKGLFSQISYTNSINYLNSDFFKA